MGKINPRQQKFCQEYLLDFNATQAAIRAGYSKKTARQIGQQNLTKLDIKKYLSQITEKITKKMELDAQYVITKIHETYLFNSEVEEKKKRDNTVHKSMRNAKVALKSLELLGKYFKLFTEVVETRNYEEIEKRLRMGIERVKKYQEEDKND
jgi:phage terminase small subunit